MPLPGSFFLGLDAPSAQPLSKGLAPPAQVFLARIQAFAVTPFRAHADVHMRVRLVRVQDHHVAVVRQLGLRKLPRGLPQHMGIRAGRHRQHDVEGLAALADLRDARAAEPPLIGDRAQGLPALAHGAAVVFDRKPPCLGDVAQVGCDGAHATTAASDLDHHLGRAALNRRADALLQQLGALPNGCLRQNRRTGRGHAVRRVEQPVTPLHEQAIDGAGHGSSPSQAVDQR